MLYSGIADAPPPMLEHQCIEKFERVASIARAASAEQVLLSLLALLVQAGTWFTCFTSAEKRERVALIARAASAEHSSPQFICVASTNRFSVNYV